jgi:hypothetical protein
MKASVETLEAIMASIHRVTSAMREIDNPKQPDDFKARLQADLPARLASMRSACAHASEVTELLHREQVQ